MAVIVGQEYFGGGGENCPVCRWDRPVVKADIRDVPEGAIVVWDEREEKADD